MKEERKIFANTEIRLEMDDLANVSGGITDYFGTVNLTDPSDDKDALTEIYTNW